MQDVEVSDESARMNFGAKRDRKGSASSAKSDQKKLKNKYSSSPYNSSQNRRQSKVSSSGTEEDDEYIEDEIGYGSESYDYGSENKDYAIEVSGKKKSKKDKRRMDLDFDNEYHPLRLGLKLEKRLIVIEYQDASTKKVF